MKNTSIHITNTGFRSFCIAVSLFIGGIMLPSTAALAQTCSQPNQPDMPDGAEASMEAMLTGQKAVKAFQASNMEYMQCLERKYSAAETRVKKSKDADVQAAARQEYKNSIDAYNAAVSAEEAVADAFNVALRAYKAANK